MINIKKVVVISLTISCFIGSKILFAQKDKDSETKKVVFQDNFIGISSWEKYKAEGAEIKLSSSKSNDGGILKIDYDLGTKEWVAIEKPVNLILKDNIALKFRMLSTGGNNNFEIKFIDKDGSIFGNKIFLPTEGWQNIVINLDEFEYWWGGDDKLDIVSKIGFAISKKRRWQRNGSVK